MLKPIHRVSCSPALAACQQLMRRFSLWLCDPATTPAHLSEQGLQPPVLASTIEANWLWKFLRRKDLQRSLLSRAQTIAALPPVSKAALTAWIQTVSAIQLQFQPASAPWPTTPPLTIESNWVAFRELMDAFYEKGFRGGLPYLADGTPVAAGGVSYADFVSAFRTAHRVNFEPHAREVCVLCGGPLGDTPHVDHWVLKSAFPLLSVCPDNLQLICPTCNEAPNKGDKPVYSAGSFADWFHPYLRPGAEALRLNYVLPELSIECSARHVLDEPKAEKLDALLNLSTRWTREFKAEYANRQGVLLRRERRRIQNAQARHTLAEIQSYIRQWQEDLNAGQPHHEVHMVLALALQEPARITAWHIELAAAT
ncbi:hypothetical protein Hrubri_0017 [Herbaspirillum rubrisubalbicans M1]|uniref:HNH endonuclease signature motif containing protein n=1 Tax=Herbaspirillum rubrisubalbicans TaxID=80842 RepID=UPI00073A8588|nr:HNH endonuclease [Herbaspirillum rubrisubalbicans]ALU87251.1 hypothetical protein Hrubri_0017 [Herbaspirillum rubrisubalbicans M1]